MGDVRETGDRIDEKAEKMIERAAKLDLIRDAEADWIADTVAELWQQPEEFANGELFEQPDDVAREDFNLFRFGVLFGIEYENRYPTGGDWHRNRN
jgi:hypothetical protein